MQLLVVLAVIAAAPIMWQFLSAWMTNGFNWDRQCWYAGALRAKS
jgi:hypothetical protein